MYAYVDETGNTGPNIFDAAQPRFLTAALLTRAKFDAVHGGTVRSIAGRVGAKVLHANELGPEKVEAIARPLCRVLKKADARFVFSNLEKRYLAVTKIVDYVFDCGENLAVPWQTYRHGLVRSVLFTDGAKYVADKAGAYWLLDEIALTQRAEPKVAAEPFQVWTLTVNRDRTAVLACENGNCETVLRKEIPVTDFPLDTFRLYFTDNTILLPSEY